MEYNKLTKIPTKRIFIPQSLSSYEEVNNFKTKKLLIEINQYYLVFNETPPIEYLSFLMSEPVDQIEKAIKFLSHHNWFSMAYRGTILKYYPTDKFKKSFYHYIKEFIDRGPK